MGATVTIGRPGQFAEFERRLREALKAAALRATDRAARQAAANVRGQIQSAGLGRLSGAITSGSDLQRGRGVHPKGADFAASGWVKVRGRSERTLGALAAYTRGATITARNATWLAIATDHIPKRAGRQKMTPRLYVAEGFDQKIGPLVFVKGRSGREAFLIVRDVSVDKFGRKGRYARRLPRRGALGSSRARAGMLIAFVLIRLTSRSARFDPSAPIAAAVAQLPALVAEELKKEI